MLTLFVVVLPQIGGALRVEGRATQMTIDDCLFEQNAAVLDPTHDEAVRKTYHFVLV
jgi:hypothetical protein